MIRLHWHVGDSSIESLGVGSARRSWCKEVAQIRPQGCHLRRHDELCHSRRTPAPASRQWQIQRARVSTL